MQINPIAQAGNAQYTLQKVQKQQETRVFSRDIDDINNHKTYSNKYNVTNMSFNDLSNLSSELYDAGEISLLEHAIITFNPQQSSQKVVGESSYFKSDDLGNGNRNWIEEFKLRYEYDSSVGNQRGYTNNKKIYDLLLRINSAK